ncbi:HAD-IIB family hydrolase [Bacillus sp. NEAU-CP5]|uniref:HAD-IIB family hydrolase n=1 Tax=Bacillus TaxID=1386 RepID=UPI0022540AE1|nr:MULTISPECIES: HAD-IIB family hydrolase [Bacillus]MCX3305164.1 HAD-IIB family hydrolase [Bacillus velezensis]MCX8439764.1 HAD-IIB family hydrolase [Bacillus sp. NEAU-CP5]WJF82825.1 HAD-IIB family hydrolase [Bacillus velezensis]
MIKLVITDLDGTFLNNQGDFDRTLFEKTKRVMEEQHVAFAICTGKQCERVEALFGEDAKDFWILGDSATRIKKNGKFVYESLISNDAGLSIIGALEKISCGHSIIACTKNGAIVKENLSESEMKYVNASYAHVTKITDFTEIKDDFIKITVHDPDANCPETREKLHEFFHQLYIVASEDTWMDISNIGIHKGTTVQELQRLLGVSADETMAFGDGRNDKELMEAASYSFAVKNAIDEIKDAAHFVIKSNEDSSVMHTIMRILALQKQ